MGNLKQWILREAKGEPIYAVVIGAFGWGGFHEDTAQQIPGTQQEHVLNWDEASELIDYEFDSGYGAPSCHAVYVWTATKVMWITQYDGATSLSSMPRHPMDGPVEMPGG